jgi:hypothetical protein
LSSGQFAPAAAPSADPAAKNIISDLVTGMAHGLPLQDPSTCSDHEPRQRFIAQGLRTQV